MSDNYFNKKEDKNKNNEALLDSIMQQQKQREEKYNIKKPYLLSNNKKKQEVSVFKKAGQAESDNKNVGARDFFDSPNTSNNRGVPMYVINKKDLKRHSSGKGVKSRGVSFSLDANKLKKIGIGIACFLAFAAIVAILIVAITFTEKHKVTITCGNFDGITITDTNDKEITEISLKINETFKFKVTVNDGYKKNSKLIVSFNDEEIKPDQQGVYSITHKNSTLNLHISGVRQDELAVSIHGAAGHYIRNNNNSVIPYGTKDFLYNNMISFRVVNSVGDTLKENSYSVYYNGVLQEKDNLNYYNIKIIDSGTIDICNHSAYEQFVMEEVVKNDKVESYNITNLTSKAQDYNRIFFPTLFNGKPVNLKFLSSFSNINVTHIGVSKTANVSGSDFLGFLGLQVFEVFPFENQGPLSIFNNGILIKNSEGVVEVVSIPTSFNVTKITFDQQSLKLTEGCISNCRVVKQIEINATNLTIEDGAFNKIEGASDIKFTINNSATYKTTTDGKSILKSTNGTDFNTLFVVTHCNSTYVVPSNVTTITKNAFKNTAVQTIDFSDTTNLQLTTECLSNLLYVSKIKLPNYITQIPEKCFYGCKMLTTLDLSDFASAIHIDPTAFEACYNKVNILVKAELLESFKGENQIIESYFVSK